MPVGVTRPAARRIMQALRLPAWSAAQAGVQMSVALLTARWLGPTDRGTLVLATTLGSLLLLISSMGLTTAARLALAEPQTWWTWGRYIPLSGALIVPHLALSALLGLPVLAALTGAHGALLLLFLLYSALALPTSLLREGLHGLGRHSAAIVIDVVAAFLQLSLVAVAFALGKLSVVTALAIASLSFGIAVAAQLVVGRTSPTRVRCDGPDAAHWARRARRLLMFSLPALVTSLGQAFVVNGDRILIGVMGTPADVGIYSAAASLAALSWILPIAFTAVVTRRVAETASLRPWEVMHSRLLGATVGLTMLVSVAGYFALPILVGADYITGRVPLVILAIAAVPFASYQIDAAANAGLRDLQAGARGALWGSVSLVCVGSLLIPGLGGRGCALAVLLSYCVMALVARRRLRRLQARLADSNTERIEESRRDYQLN